MSETLTYEADGLAMRGQLFRPEGSGPHPGVLVFPEAFGLSELALERAERLAATGHVALACDLHGDAKRIEEVGPAVAAIKPLMQAPERNRDRAGQALAALLAAGDVDASRVAAIGFCFGGTMALELARSGAALRAAVGFHSGLSTTRPEDAKNIQGRVMVCIGADDPMIDPDQRLAFEREMRDGGVDWQMHLYGGTVHGFTNPHAGKRNMPDAIRYSPTADTQSWASMTALFEHVLRG